MKKYMVMINNYQKGKYLPLYAEYAISIEKVDRYHCKIVFLVDDFYKTRIEKCFNRKLQAIED